MNARGNNARKGKVGFQPLPLLERINRNLRVNGDCVEWTGAATPHGYGRIQIRGRNRRAHRVVYEMLNGPVPEHLHMDHLCRNPACVNPAHLEPVTPRENVLRGSGVTAVNARKTHCKRGHPFSGGNLTWVLGKRVCRTCRRSWGK